MSVLSGHGPLSLSKSLSIAESYRLIDEAIVQHQASILDLKSQKNSLAPISRLPPEILCKIFLYARRIVQPDEGHYPRFSLTWIAVTHVCSHWRHVAINFPSLWADLPLGNARWVEEMLRRSKDAGLILDIYVGTSPGNSESKGLHLALKHISRVKHLTFRDIYDVSLWNDLQKDLPKSAPQLESFSTGGGEDGWAIRFDDSQMYPIAISEDVFCDTERLRHLELHMCNPNWNSHPSLFRSLTYLKLHDIPLASRPTANQFVDALKGMPDLRFLDLQHAFPIEHIPWSSNRVHFASLRTLSVQSIHTEVEGFFRSVSFPSTTNVRVACIVDSTFASDVDLSSVISSLIRSYSNTLSDEAFQTLVCPRCPSVPHQVHLRLFEDHLDDVEIIQNRGQISDFSPQLELLFAWKTEPAERYVQKLMLNDIFGGVIPLQGVTHIYLGLDEPIQFEPGTIANTFGKLPRLKSVIANRKSSNVFLKALEFGIQSAEAMSNIPIEKLYFPSLSTIWLYQTKFWRPYQPEEMQDTKSISVKSLEDYLIQRSDSGAKIDCLKLQHCHRLGKPDVDSLAQFVSSIEWDEEEDFGVSVSENECVYDDEDDYGTEEYNLDYDRDYDFDPDYNLDYDYDFDADYYEPGHLNTIWEPTTNGDTYL